MKNTFQTIALSLALVSGVVASAAQHPIGFQVWTGEVAPFDAAPGTSVELANETFLAKYGAENGMLGTGVGVRGELRVFVARRNVAREIWRKMLGSGDGFAGAGGVGYIRFEDGGSTVPTFQYVFLGRQSVEEGNTGIFYVLNGTPAITGFMVAMEEKCGMGQAGVVAVQQPIAPTRLLGSRRIGSYSIGYEYSVNNGMGALVSQINASVARRHFGPFLVDICPVDLYIKY
ncbi:MAG: hypothetical protein HYR96_03000 [Deltaproteobacteria bacterium]|nr:hypothetical protein [Deltaproteobacteria bacterium]MBI3294067.1 hypothetical protein [Deltaproteobacteria bacterium]